MVHCNLDVDWVGFTLELQELKQLVEDQHMATEGLHKELAEVSAKSQAAPKRKMAGLPPLCKWELLKIREQDAKPEWVYASLLAMSTLLWRREVQAHEYVSRFPDKENSPMSCSMTWHQTVMHRTTRCGACLESMNDEEIERVKAFVRAV